jgi:hypothetical protein
MGVWIVLTIYAAALFGGSLVGAQTGGDDDGSGVRGGALIYRGDSVGCRTWYDDRPCNWIAVAALAPTPTPEQAAR